MNISKVALTSNIRLAYLSSWRCIVQKLVEVAREKYRIHLIDELSFSFSHLLPLFDVTRALVFQKLSFSTLYLHSIIIKRFRLNP